MNVRMDTNACYKFVSGVLAPYSSYCNLTCIDNACGIESEVASFKKLTPKC